MVGTFPETFTVLCAGLESEAERQGCNARRVVFARDFCFTKNGATCRLSRSYEQKREILLVPKGNETASICIQDSCGLLISFPSLCDFRAKHGRMVIQYKTSVMEKHENEVMQMLGSIIKGTGKASHQCVPM